LIGWESLKGEIIINKTNRDPVGLIQLHLPTILKGGGLSMKTRNCLKKIIDFILISLIIVSFAWAGPVSSLRASKAAINFLTKISGLNRSSVSIEKAYVFGDGDSTTYYIFNMRPKGYIILAADDACHPLLGYSLYGRYDPTNHPPALDDLLNSRSKEIGQIIKKKIPSSTKAEKYWKKLDDDAWTDINEAYPQTISELDTITSAVAPLTTTQWHQGVYCNALCPADPAGVNGHALTGCVATAIGQVLKKWNYPTTGNGTHSYTDNHYGLQSVDYGSTTYNWAAMVDSLTSSNYEVARLLYHCGVGVNMDYGVEASGAYNTDAPSVFRDHFRYSRSVTYSLKDSFPSDESWDAVMRQELDNGRPVLYGGFRPKDIILIEGHSFVVDGYQYTDYFHINWGWNGSSNGYYYLEGLSDLLLFPNDQEAVYRIIPATMMPEPELNSVAVPTSVAIGEYIELSISADNSGSQSDDGGITVSFPDLTGPNDDQQVDLISTSAGMGYHEYPKGQQIYTRQGYQIPANCLMVEATHTSWDSDSTKAMVIRVAPKQLGTFTFYVRSAMGKSHAYLNSPNESQQRDQQHWEVTKYTVNVNSIKDIRQSGLILNKLGAVYVDVKALEANDYKVAVWDDDGFTTPEWSWTSTSSSPVSLGALDSHTFTFTVIPDDLSEGFEFWLYKKDFLGLYKIIDKVQVVLYAQVPDSVPPTVLSRSAGTSKYTSILIKFSENMDPLSLNGSTLQVVGSASGQHSCVYTFDYASNTLTINPNTGFSFGEIITVNVGTGVTDVSGNHLSLPYQFSFTIESEPADDNVPPSLQFTAPTSADTADLGFYVVRWTDSDPDNNALIRLYFDTDSNYSNGGYQPIKDDNGALARIYEDGNLNNFYWDTTSVSGGTYYLLAVLEDGVNAPVIRYSTGTVHVALPSTGNHFELNPQSSWVWNDNKSVNNQAYINGVPEGLETLDINLPIRNHSGIDVKFVYGTLSSTVGAIDFSNGDNFIYYGNITAGQYVVPDDDFNFKVNVSSYSNTPFKLHLEYQDLSGTHYTQDFNFTVTFPAQGATAPLLVAGTIVIDDSGGDGDHVWESGERIGFFIPLRNNGTAACVNPRGVLEQKSTWGSTVFTDPDNNYQDILVGQTQTNTNAFNTDNAPMTFAGEISTNMTVSYGPGRDQTLTLPITLTVMPTAHIRFSPEAYDFGIVAPGTAVAHTETVMNRGSGTMVISDIIPSDLDTTITGITYPATIPAGGSATFTMNVVTTSIDGFITRTASVISNAYEQGASRTFALTGTVTNATPTAIYIKLWEQLRLDSEHDDLNNVIVGDTDNDGNQEIIFTTSGHIHNINYPGRLYIYEKTADNTFTLRFTSSDLGGIPDTHSLALGDFDKDGLTDIVVLASSSLVTTQQLPFRVFWFEATGTTTNIWTTRGTGGIAVNGGTTYGLECMTVGDSDDDTNLEIVLSRPGDVNPVVLVYEYNSGSFTLRWTSPVVVDRNGNNVSSVSPLKVANTDGDAHSEIIFGTDNGQLYIYETTGPNGWNSTWRLQYNDPYSNDWLGYGLKDMAVEDTDGDGRKEIIHVCEDEGILSIFEATGNDTWNTSTPEHYALPNQLDPYCVAVGDTDNDAKNEIVIGGYSRDDRHVAVFEPIADNSHMLTWASTLNEVNYEPVSLAIVNTNSTPAKEIFVPIPGPSSPVLAYQIPLDLRIVDTNIGFDPASIIEAGTVAISAIVQNPSPSAVDSVLVRFYNGDPASGGIQIGTDQTIPTIAAGASVSAQITWQPYVSGVYPIFVVVDPNNTIAETDDSNNKALKSLTVFDNDILGPIISDIIVAEYNGNGNGLIEDNEQVRISWLASDPSGIASCAASINGVPCTVTGASPYEVIAGPFTEGGPSFIIVAQDGDNSPATSEASGAFSVHSHSMTVTSTYPTRGQNGISVRPAIDAAFDKPINLATLNSTTIILRDSGLHAIGGAISYVPQGNIVRFIPSVDLTNSMTYAMTLIGGASGILSETGSTLAESYVWTFDIEADATLPTAMISSPSGGDYVVGVVLIHGTAWDKNFKEYRVYYGEGASPSVWTPITGPLTTSVTGSELCQWDTSVLGLGQYTIKLDVLDNPPASNHAVATAVINIGKVATPTLSLTPGSYSLPQDITISCSTPGATIYYTTNGSDPTQSAVQYTAPVHIAATQTLKARAFRASMRDSEIVSGLYEIAKMITVASPNGGEIWATGTKRDITWTQTGLTGTVTIDLYKGGAWKETLGAPEAASGAFSWTIASTEPAGADYTIRIWQSGSASDDSETSFSIVHMLKVDFNKDGQEDLLWRCYGTGARQGENVAWFMTQNVGLSAETLAGAKNVTGEMPLLTAQFQNQTYMSPMDVGGTQTAGPIRTLVSPLNATGQDKPTKSGDGSSGSLAQANSLQITMKELNSDTVLQDMAFLATGDAKTMALGYSDAPLYAVLDLTWEIAGAGDFNGDGNTDILWRFYGAGEGQGTTIIWFMNGTSISSQGYPYQVTDTDWKIDRVGDFNRDGKADILWRYYGSGGGQGTAIIWCMDGATVIDQIYPYQVLDTNWKIDGIGDFDGDGKADLLWRYYGTGGGQGTTIIWYMDGATTIGQGYPTSISDTDWRVDGTGDFNGDGRADIVWRYHGAGVGLGTTIIWYMNGATTIGQDRPYWVQDLNWRIVNH
jgi:hypothetical protein